MDQRARLGPFDFHLYLLKKAMPSQKAVLRDIHDMKLDPNQAHSVTRSAGRLVKRESRSHHHAEEVVATPIVEEVMTEMSEPATAVEFATEPVMTELAPVTLDFDVSQVPVANSVPESPVQLETTPVPEEPKKKPVSKKKEKSEEPVS